MILDSVNFGGGGGSKLPRLMQRLILSSMTYIAPFSGNYIVVALGGGGGGARGGYNASATGGAAGGAAFKAVKLSAGDGLISVIGAGGAISSGAANAVGGNGNAGGTTTVTGPGIALSAGGGGGGLFSAATAGVLNAPVGGSATGGDLNVTGGRPDSITLQQGSYYYSGGAAAGIYGFTPPNVVLPSGSSGGGSVLGTAGAANAATNTNGYTFGNSNAAHARYMIGPSTRLGRLYSVGSTPASDTGFLPSDVGWEFLDGNLLCPIGLGGTAMSAYNQLNVEFSNGGAGAGGNRPLFVTDGAGMGGMYAGGGGCQQHDTQGFAGGRGGFCGGGGGGICAPVTPSTYLMHGGAGGVGGVIIQYLGA